MTENAPATGPAVAPSSRDRLRAVLRNPRVRKLQLAFIGSALGDWTFATAVVVFAYQAGGVGAVGGYQAARFIGMAVAGPLGGALADRMPRRRFMICANLGRATLVATAATLVAVDGPTLAVVALAITSAIAGASFRAAQAGLLPDLVDDPGELTAANAVAGNLESMAIFAGPALAGLLIALTDVEVVFWLAVGTYLWSVLLLLSLRPPRSEVPAADTGASGHTFWRDLGSGFALVGRHPDLRAVALISGSLGFVWGSLTVFMVVLATDVLEAGPEGLGYLNAVFGVATVIGGVAVLARVGSARLGQDMVIGAFGWSLPLLVLAAFPSPVTALLAIGVIGLSDPIATLGFETIPQRVTPQEFISRVYSAIGSALIAPMSLGAILAPVLVDQVGLRASLVVVASVALATAVALLPHMRRLDQRLEEPADLPLLRTVPIFLGLGAPALESLAHASERRGVPAGTVVLAEGGASDCFFVIVSGQVAVTQAGVLQRTEGAGEFFGEIGLLRDVPRTATVTATSDTELLVIERADFLAAVNGMGDARSVLDEIVARRLGA